MSFCFPIGFLPISWFAAKLLFCFRWLFLLFRPDLLPPLRKPLPCLCLRLLNWPKFLLAFACASSTAASPVGLRSWFFNNSSFLFSTIKSTDINLKYFVKFLCRYCCCKMMLDAWKVENVLFSISALETLTPYNSNWVTISNNAELYSDTDLKSCSLKCYQTY